MKIIHIQYGGPERIIIDGKGKKWRFEDHPYCGPVVLTGKTGEISENQPPERSAFWDAVNLWYSQGKRINDVGNGEVWCIWDKPPKQKMRHICGNHYMLVTNQQEKAN